MFEQCASILAADFANLERDMRAANAAGVDAFHIDVMDGHFVRPSPLVRAWCVRWNA